MREGRLADNALVGFDAAPSVILDGLAPADDTGVGFDTGDFELGPGVHAGAFHFGADAVDEGHLQGEAFYVGYFGGHSGGLSFDNGFEFLY